MIRRAIIIVLDSLGVGEMPDAAKYGDQGADTLGHILDHCPQLQIPNLQKMGMGNIKDAAGHDYRTLGDRRSLYAETVQNVS